MSEIELKKLYNVILSLENNHEVPIEDVVEMKALFKEKKYASVLKKLKEVKQLLTDKKEERENSKNQYNQSKVKNLKIVQAVKNIERDERTKEQKNNDSGIPNIDLDPNFARMDTLKKEKNPDIFPEDLSDINLEQAYIALLLDNVKSISMYYFKYEEEAFLDPRMLNLYKCILFTDGEAYASNMAKKSFNFGKDNEQTFALKERLRKQVKDKEFNFEKVYTELKKLFRIRKAYNSIPIKELQDKVEEIVHYELYDKMSVEEVDAAIEQVTVTGKFKKSILSEGVTDFLMKGDNKLTNGIPLPFPILSSVFKGLRQGETMAYAMPSNSGKSRFTINLAASLAFIHHKKVLVISNEMSEEKMKLCLITTIINNPDIQKLHGQKLYKTEGELLDFKYRPNDAQKVDIDKDGFVAKKENETQEDFLKRLATVSDEFNQTVKATKWLDEQMANAIYFINITDHTNDELQKVIINYYYKEKIEYVFYDTLKTDTENIGNGEEIKRTATILSNLAQNFNIFIGSSLQLSETKTLPINLDINDLAVSRTVKEVLDTLCLIKQISKDNLFDYEYSLNEVDTKFFELENFDNPDVRYYACVVDKNRAGAKPRLLFRLNLAYNEWNELGYLKLKQQKVYED